VSTHSGRIMPPQSPAEPPALWLRYGVSSSRNLERVDYDSVAFHFITSNDHPDQDTIGNFRRRLLNEIGVLFVSVLLLAREIRALKMGTVTLAGIQCQPR
jgi:hypothetical protein